MKRTGILIVDDSAFARSLIREIIDSAPDLQVIGEAADGAQAVRMNSELHPDLITLDITMPVMGGLGAIEQIMATAPVPILVLTSLTDADTAFQAISRGALEVAKKPQAAESDRVSLIAKISLLARVPVIRHMRRSAQRNPSTPPVLPRPLQGSGGRSIIAIAASTGGPKALAGLFGRLPADIPAPILIAQHIGGGFSSSLVSWLNQVSPLQVTTARHHEQVLDGHAYIAPDGYHIEIDPFSCIRLTRSEPSDPYTPSCDRLFTSLASYIRTHAVGIILSGMGADGTKGLTALHEAGGRTIAQDEESSVIFGMPKAAIEARCVDSILPLDAIAAQILAIIRYRGSLS